MKKHKIWSEFAFSLLVIVIVIVTVVATITIPNGSVDPVCVNCWVLLATKTTAGYYEFDKSEIPDANCSLAQVYLLGDAFAFKKAQAFVGLSLESVGNTDSFTPVKDVIAVFTDVSSTPCNMSTLFTNKRDIGLLDYLVSFPRSGSHMTQDLMEHYTGISPSTEWDGEEPDNLCYHMASHSLFVKTHYPYSAGNTRVKQYLNAGTHGKIVWVVRSVFSMLPSFHLWNYKFNSGASTDKFETFVRKSVASYLQFFDFWSRKRNKDRTNILVVKYDDIYNNQHASARTVMDFLQVSSREQTCGHVNGSFFADLSRSAHSKVNKYGPNYLHFWCFLDNQTMQFVINATRQIETYFGFLEVIDKTECSQYKTPPDTFDGKHVAAAVKRRGVVRFVRNKH